MSFRLDSKEKINLTHTLGTISNRIFSSSGSAASVAWATGRNWSKSNSKMTPVGGLRTKFFLSCWKRHGVNVCSTSEHEREIFIRIN